MAPVDFTPEDAQQLANVTRRARNFQGGVLMTEKGGIVDPADLAIVAKYRQLCTALQSADATQLGFRSWDADTSVLTQEQADAIITEVIRPLDNEPSGWQRRGSSSSELAQSGVPGTQRRTFGVELDCKYRVVARSEMPPLLRELGERLLKRCAACEWPYSRGGDASVLAPVAGFEQAYIQRYVPGQPSATLGFHFDSFGSFGELIVGVTLAGSARLLLRKCGPAQSGDFVREPATVLSEPRTFSAPLAPLAAYAITGLSRYDLKHAVVNDTDTERLSVTFRTVNWRTARSPKPRRAAEAPSSPPPPKRSKASEQVMPTESRDDIDALFSTHSQEV